MVVWQEAPSAAQTHEPLLQAPVQQSEALLHRFPVAMQHAEATQSEPPQHVAPSPQAAFGAAQGLVQKPLVHRSLQHSPAPPQASPVTLQGGGSQRPAAPQI